MTLQLPNGYVDAGAAAMHDRGTWVNGFSESINGITYQGYAYGDIVHKASGVYMSLVDGNTTDPDTDTTSSWRTYLDKTDTSAVELSRCVGIQWNLDDDVKNITIVGNTALYPYFKTWVDTSAKPCEIKKDKSDFAYLRNTEGVAHNVNWAYRADGSASHYNTSDKTNYLQMVEYENINVGEVIDMRKRTMTVYFNWDREAPYGFHRWFKADRKLFARYDATINSDGSTFDIAYGLSQGSSWSMSADSHLAKCKATGAGLLAETLWEIVVQEWIQIAYFQTFDVPSSARGRGMQDGSQSTAVGYVNGTNDTLTKHYGSVNGNSCMFMYRENPTDGKQWKWGYGTYKNSGVLYMTFDEDTAQVSALLDTANAEKIIKFPATAVGWYYPKNADIYGMPFEQTGGGSASTGTCDGIYDDNTSDQGVYVGGYSGGGSFCGVRCRTLDGWVLGSYWYRRGGCTLNR